MKKWNPITFLAVALLITILSTANVSAEGMQETTQENTTESNQTISLDKPEVENIIATAKGNVKIYWGAVDNAQKYIVYRSKDKKNYTKITATKKTYYIDRTGKANTTYYYRIVAAKKDTLTNQWLEGKHSKARKIKVRKQAQKVAFVGDSIMTGFGIYHVTQSTDKLFAKIGLNATSFYRSELRGQLLRYNPDRLILMFGMNGLPGSPSDVSMYNQVNCISKIIKECRKKNPNMEIVIMGVSPVSSRAHVKLSSVKSFNDKLEKSLLHKKDVHYYTPARVLADSNGYLKSGYGGGDGIHWSATAYKLVYEDLKSYVKEWK